MKSYMWVVMGFTGEYADRSEWLYKGFDTQESAQEEVDRLNSILRELKVHAEMGDLEYDQYGFASPTQVIMQKEDPMFRMDYTGSSYSSFRIERG